MKDFFRFFRGHSLLCSQLYKFVNVSLCFIRCFRIDDSSAGDIKSSLCRFLFDFIFIADQNDLGNSLFQNFFGCLKSSHILCFRQHDCLNVLFCSFFEHVNISHDKWLLSLFQPFGRRENLH